MVEAWMPGAARLRAATDGGRMNGGAPRAVWLTTQTEPGAISARSAAQCLTEQDRSAHLAWNPVNGQIVQMLPITRAACGQPCGRDGRLCVQIRVIGFAEAPFTSGPACGLAAIVAWLETWGIARDWPAGAPGLGLAPVSRRVWSRGGHFAGSQLPRNPECGPGAVDVEQIIGGMALVPRPRDRLRAEPAAELSTPHADEQAARLTENDGPLTRVPLVSASATSR